MVFLHLHSSVTKNKRPSKQSTKIALETSAIYKKSAQGSNPQGFSANSDSPAWRGTHQNWSCSLRSTYKIESMRFLRPQWPSGTTTDHETSAGTFEGPCSFLSVRLLNLRKQQLLQLERCFKKKLFFLGNLATHTNIPPSSFPQHHVQRRKYSKTSEKKNEKVILIRKCQAFQY